MRSAANDRRAYRLGAIAHDRAAGCAGTAEDDCALGGTGYRVARVGGFFLSRPCAPLSCPSNLSATRPTPSVFPSSTRQWRSAGQGRFSRMLQHPLEKRLKLAPSPDGCRNSLGVGRVARRARPDTKPFSSSLPRLTLKAGHKAGLPTSPIAVYGATGRRIAVTLFKRKCIPTLGIFISEYLYLSIIIEVIDGPKS